MGPASHEETGFAGPRNPDAARIRTTELFRHCRAVANSRKYGPVPAFSIASRIEELPGVAAPTENEAWNDHEQTSDRNRNNSWLISTANCPRTKPPRPCRT